MEIVIVPTSAEVGRVAAAKVATVVALKPSAVLEHPESYASVIAREVVEPLGFDPTRDHVPDGRANDLELAAKEHDIAIREAGGIDLQILDEAAAADLQLADYYRYTYANKPTWQLDQ